ncbi:phage tail collar domain protein [Ruminiclostridium hungatei]|uniref:Phage tail collar domain protein n=1 Tax=Ruminiclostridium hungatei TaxID=48256 RepID=A0A1V4SPA0_RUMHU|nr:tail fiber protein [Ruminiclostridium hungatei]OPX45623.1 phage tail collar domain protein [Ruminiclostridium hungatei]
MDIEYYIGGIVLFPYNFAPAGWAPCQGQILQISQYQALFALIGATYGGDGRTTFALPNLKGASPLPDMGYYIATIGIFPTRP